jgi:DNA polymerase Pol2
MKNASPDKKIFLDARQESLKTLSNSFYGYLGFYAARWYTKESARAVTAYGRHYIHKVIDTAKEKGFGVLYSDTDSIFIHLNGKTIQQALDFCGNINADLPGVMELEYEGTFPRALFVSMKVGDLGAKKKYALIDEKGKIIIKGFESVRRNVSPIAKKTQMEVLKILLNKNDPKRALEYVRSVISSIKDKTIPIDDLCIPTQLTKPIKSYDSVGPHVAAAKLLAARGVEIFPGMIITYVVTAGKEKIRDRVKLPDVVKPQETDSDYYIYHQVLPAIDKIMEVFGYDGDAIVEGKSQSTLGSYFKK